ncbi:MAG: ATP-binding protein [Candidatus Obscuribacterales bacterium]
MLRTTHKIALLIIVPLIIELCFLGVVMSTVDELEKDRMAESRAVEALVYVNLILNDTWNAAGSMMMFKATQTDRFILEFHDLNKVLTGHATKLKELLEGDAQTPEARQFLGIVDDILATFKASSGMMDDEYEISNVRLIGKLRTFIKELNSTGLKVIEQQTRDRERYQQKQVLSRSRVKMVLGSAAVANVILAVTLAIIFSLTFAKRFKVLMDNTMNIAIGKPLGDPLTGTDELALLDTVIHNLSTELEITREKERAMIDNTAVIICSLNESYRITELNPAIEIATGYDIAELLGSNMVSMIHEDDRDRVFDRLENCKNSASEIEFEARLRKKDGRFLSTEWNANWAAGSKSIFCVIHDITQRKEAERLKQEVIAMVSHDLRAPLTSLGVILDMMMEGIVGELNERGTRLVRLAKQSVSSLITMINDLLDVERYESGGLLLNYERTTTEEVLENAIGMIKPEADKKQIRIEKGFESQAIRLDAERINRVLVNLLSNAVKFSPEKSSVMVLCKHLEIRREEFVFEFKVIDEGPGIPPEKLKLVFEKFKQVGSGSEGEKKGSGLGLAICKAIVEAHGGEIGVESVEGSGSTFWFRIPPDQANVQGEN